MPEHFATTPSWMPEAENAPGISYTVTDPLYYIVKFQGNMIYGESDMVGESCPLTCTIKVRRRTSYKEFSFAVSAHKTQKATNV